MRKLAITWQALEEGRDEAPRAGDRVALYPENDPELVEALAHRLELDLDAPLSIRVKGALPTSSAGKQAEGECTVREVLQLHCEIARPARRQLLRELAEHCEDGDDRLDLLHLASKEGANRLRDEVKDEQPTLLNLLQAYPSCRPPLSSLLHHLPRLEPRLYSVANAATYQPGRVEVAYSSVRWTSPSGILRFGVCTNYLDEVTKHFEGDEVEEWTTIPFDVHPAKPFRQPNPRCPIIMIAPGAGVAPFRGFLQERRKMVESGEVGRDELGESWLFFGCRVESENALFKPELASFLRQGELSRLVLSRSREAEFAYVQDKIQGEHREDVARLLLQDATHCFFCGDGTNAVRGAHAGLVASLKDAGGLRGDEAEEHLARLAREGRYVRDIWSP